MNRNDLKNFMVVEYHLGGVGNNKRIFIDDELYDRYGKKRLSDVKKKFDLDFNGVSGMQGCDILKIYEMKEKGFYKEALNSDNLKLIYDRNAENYENYSLEELILKLPENLCLAPYVPGGWIVLSYYSAIKDYCGECDCEYPTENIDHDFHGHTPKEAVIKCLKFYNVKM